MRKVYFVLMAALLMCLTIGCGGASGGYKATDFFEKYKSVSANEAEERCQKEANGSVDHVIVADGEFFLNRQRIMVSDMAYANTDDPVRRNDNVFFYHKESNNRYYLVKVAGNQTAGDVLKWCQENL